MSPRAAPEPSGADAFAIDESTLDDQVRLGDPDRWLATRLIADPAARADAITLLAFDLELARAPRRASNPLVGEIRLTWWGEALDEMFGAGRVRRHPVALALAELVARHGLPRAPLEALIDVRYVELDKRELTQDEAVTWADRSAGGVARLTARMLDPGGALEAAGPAGQAWGLAQAARLALIHQASAAQLVKAALAEHRRAPRLSVAAFPAAAVGALAMRLLKPGDMSDVGKRARLLWASVRGRC